MIRRLASSLILAALLCTLPLATASATAPSIEKGLLITPPRQFLSADAGKTIHSSFSVANLTNRPLTVDLQAQNFSVTDYAYTYTFSKPTNSWVRLSTSSVELEANKTQTIDYDVDIPAKAAPGGQYYTLLASATLQSGSIKNTIQAADLVYLAVNGQLSTASHLESSHIRTLNFGREIPFVLHPINTGNVYSFVYVSGQLHGLSARPPQTSSGRMLMPGRVRTLEGDIPSPVLPGVYKATYGYKTDSNWIVQESHWIVYLPPWSIAFVLALALVLPKLITRFRRNKKATVEN